MLDDGYKIMGKQNASSHGASGVAVKLDSELIVMCFTRWKGFSSEFWKAVPYKGRSSVK